MKKKKRLTFLIIKAVSFRKIVYPTRKVSTGSKILANVKESYKAGYGIFKIAFG